MTNLKIYPYEELKVTSKPRLPSDIDRDHLEVCSLLRTKQNLHSNYNCFLLSVI